MDAAAVRKLFKCAAGRVEGWGFGGRWVQSPLVRSLVFGRLFWGPAEPGVLNSAFGADEAKKCEAEVKEILGDEFVECSFESVLLALSKAIEKGLVPEPGLQTLRNLEPHFEKNGLSPSSPLCVALGLHATLKINVVTMAGEKTAHEVESKGKILGLKCKLGIPFGTKANLTFKDTLLQDSQTFADAGVEEGSDLLLVHEKMTWGSDEKSGMKDLLNFLEDRDPKP